MGRDLRICFSSDFTHSSLPHCSVQRLLVSPIPETLVNSGLLTSVIRSSTANIGFSLLRMSYFVPSDPLAFQFPQFFCCRLISHIPLFLNLSLKEIPLLFFLLGLRKEVKLDRVTQFCPCQDISHFVFCDL